MSSIEKNDPPDSLQDALDVLGQWERGEIGLSPDGIAVVRFLQQAKIGNLAAASAVELSV